MRGIISWPSALAERIGRRLRTRRISVSPLFDPDWYLEVYADVAEARVDPAVHYLARGSREGRKPHPLFDPGWYLRHHPDARERNKSTLECYLSTPPAERRYAHPLFDADFYRESYLDVAQAGADPLIHYLAHGAAEGRQPHPEFDPGWYLLNNPEVDRVGVNPLLHYLAEGAQAGLDPSPGFSSSEYLEMYPDVAEARVNPLVHYVVRGKGEGRFPTQAARRSGCVRLGADIGIAAQRELIKNSPLFDPEWYLARYQDVGESHADALNHFLLKGRSEKRDPSPWFDTGWYLEHYAEAANGALSPLAYYELVGREAGDVCRPPPDHKMWWDTLHSGDRDFRSRFALNVMRSLKRAGNAGVSVIVPVYNAAAVLKGCIKSLQRHTPASIRIIVIDDASNDKDVSGVLGPMASDPRFEILVNPSNLGYTATVNRGIAHAGQDDVVLLNSDTRVGPGFILRLRICANSANDIGSVTAVSNNAGAFSVPSIEQHHPASDQFSSEALSRAIAQTSQFICPESPTGNGFCMYVRRACLNQVGAFDADAFPVGYGEENDFCMRARQAGWRHMVDCATYVFHHRSASFGSRREELAFKGLAEVVKRYPHYLQRVDAFVHSPNMERAKVRIRKVTECLQFPGAKVRPRVLYVIAALPENAGTSLTNRDLMDALAEELETFLLQSNGEIIELFSYRRGEMVLVDYAVLSQSIHAFPHVSEEYDELVANWLYQYAIELIHVRHIARHSLGLLELAKRMEISVVFSLHDFYSVCPNVKLLDERLRFCGGTCTESDGHCTPELWPDKDVPELKHAAVNEWQSIFAKVLSDTDVLVTTSRTAREIILRNFPILQDHRFEVIPHGRDFDSFLPPRQIGPDGPMRIVLAGSLTPAKGSTLIAELAESTGKLGIELHVLGRWLDGNPPPEVFVHGAYERVDFCSRVQEIGAHLGAVLSIWPETWCHTLTELWAAGLPVVGVDCGAVGERVRQSGAGWLIRPGDTAGLTKLILGLRLDPSRYQEAAGKVEQWQAQEGIRQNCAAMAESYKQLYRDCGREGLV